MAIPLEQRVQQAIGAQAWQLLILQTENEKLRESIAELQHALSVAQTPISDPPKAP